MRAPDVPRCNLPERENYHVREIVAYADCWQSAYNALFHRHKGLIRAVTVRERVTAKAVKAAKI